MKIIFFGLGSIGRRHARLLSKDPRHELFALRTHQGDCPPEALPVKEIASWDEVDRLKPEVAFITNPTAMHIDTAIECARRGIKLFIEKPLGHSTQRLDELLDLVARNKVVTYVAYVLRFHPVIEHLKAMVTRDPCLHMHVQAASFLPMWRPGRDHTKSYSSHRDMGGGVLFDLSHELDYVDFLMGPIQGMQGRSARLGDVTVDADDCADIVASCPRGAANIHLSFLSRHNCRMIKLYFADKTVEADLIRDTVTVYSSNEAQEVISLPIERDALFQKQIDFFFGNINDRQMMNHVAQAAGLFRMICDLRSCDAKA